MKALLSLLLALPLIVAAAEPATLIRATEVKKEPATDADTVARLPENAALQALERKGGWVRVKAAGGEGWVRLLALRYGAGPARQGDTGAKQLFNVARTGTSGTEVTTGARGLDTEQIASARPNPAELAKMAGFAAEREAAASFAAQGNLVATRVEYPK